MPHPDKAHQEHDQDTEQDAYQPASIKQTMNGLYRHMFTKGYTVRPRAGGFFANHDIYVVETLKIGTAEDVKLNRLVAGDPIQTGRIDNALDSWQAEAHADAGGNKKQIRLIEAIYEGFTSATSGKNNKAYGYGLRFNANLEKPRSCTGIQAYAHIPDISWFPHLKKLTLERLLAVFPKAEAELFALTVGKAVWGNENVKIHEGAFPHQMRAALFLHGQPRTGKSTILKHLELGFKYLGFSTYLIGTAEDKFGWGEIALSDFAYREDMNDRIQKGLLEDCNLKSIATGGEVQTQRKGENAVNVKSTATVFFCTNSAGKHLFKDMDSGSLDRFKFLDTYNTQQQIDLQAEEGYSRNTYFNWKELSEQYSVSITELSMYLMALCADKFMKACGYSIVDQQLVQTGADTLTKTVDSLSDALILQTNLDYLKDVNISISHLVALAIASKENITDEGKARFITAASDKLSIGHTLLQQALSAYVATHGTSDEPYILKLHYDCYTALSSQVERWTRIPRSANDAFNSLVKELISEDGYKFAPTVAYYTGHWVEARKSIAHLVGEYQSFDKSILKNNRALRDTLDSVWSNIEKIA